MEISTDPKELAQLLDLHATDWLEAMNFIQELCVHNKIEFDRQAVVLEIKKLQGDID